VVIIFTGILNNGIVRINKVTGEVSEIAGDLKEAGYRDDFGLLAR